MTLMIAPSPEAACARVAELVATLLAMAPPPGRAAALMGDGAVPPAGAFHFPAREPCRYADRR